MQRWLLIVVACAACAADTGEHVTATLSASVEASSAFAALRDSFEHDPHDAALVKRFSAFVARYPTDATSELAKAYLGHLLLDTHDTDGARRQLAAIKEPLPGNTHDFWLSLRARLLMRDSKADAALALLEPLASKVVDLPLRTVLLEEVAVASIDAHRSLEAVAYLDGWLRAVPPHAHKEAHERAAAQLARLDPSVLEQTLTAMQSEDAGGYSAEVQRMVAEALAKHAIDAQDTKLAQRLIDSSLAKYVTGTPAGQDLRDLATSLRGANVVVSRTIGLVLPTDNAELRDAAADAARGAAFALGLPRPQNDDGTRLVTRADTSGTLEASLEELAGAGASVVLAGIDEDSAERACRWSEQNGLTVITLTAPQFVPGTHFCFDAGESRDTSLVLIVAELEKRDASSKTRRKVAFVTGASADAAAKGLKSSSLDLLPPFRCEPPFSRSRLPIDEWTQKGVHDIAVSAPSGCVRTLLSELRPGDDVGLALEATVADDAHLIRAGTRAFAVTPAATPSFEAYEQQFGAKPSYWTAIGRDAALLAHLAEASLPNDRATSVSEIARRRAQARAGLASATAALWTTDATGFAQGHKLPRGLRIVDLH